MVPSMTAFVMWWRGKVPFSVALPPIWLTLQAPDIVEAILDGKQPVELTAEKLKRLRLLPKSWEEQRQLLGFIG